MFETFCPPVRQLPEPQADVVDAFLVAFAHLNPSREQTRLLMKWASAPGRRVEQVQENIWDICVQRMELYKLGENEHYLGGQKTKLAYQKAKTRFTADMIAFLRPYLANEASGSILRENG